MRDLGMSKLHRFNVFSRKMNTTKWKLFPKHGGIYKLEKIQQILKRDTTLTSLNKCERMYP